MDHVLSMCTAPGFHTQHQKKTQNRLPAGSVTIPGSVQQERGAASSSNGRLGVLCTCVHKGERMYLSRVVSSHSCGPGSSLVQSSPPHMERGIGEWVMGTSEDGRGVVSFCEDREGSGEPGRAGRTLRYIRERRKTRTEREDRGREGGGMMGERDGGRENIHQKEQEKVHRDCGPRHGAQAGDRSTQGSRSTL